MLLRRVSRALLFGRNEVGRELCTLVTSASGGSPVTTSPPPHVLSALRLCQSNGDNKKLTVDSVLNRWLRSDGKSVTKESIMASVDYLRRFKKLDQALQVLDWTDKRGLKYLTVREHAIYIDLLGKTQGVAAAEKYFADLPDFAKRKHTYGVLLQCYCHAKEEKKAVSLLERMQALNLDLNYFDYCSLMSLHMKLGQPEVVPLLAKEMEKKGIKLHLFNYNLLISSYAHLKDFESVERVEEEMKTLSNITPDWRFYSFLAGIYIAGGLLEKAELNLKEIEKLKLKDPKVFHFLLCHYAIMGKEEEVERIWQSLKSAFPRTSNLSYLTMLQALFRLEDMSGVKRCFEEWESGCLYHDVRLANVMIKAYLKQEMIEEAKLLLDHVLGKGYVPKFSTYIPFIEYFIKIHDMDSILEFIKVGTSYVRKEERRVYISKAHMCLRYFEEKADDCHMKELHRILKQADWPESFEIWENRASDASERTDEVDTSSEDVTK